MRARRSLEMCVAYDWLPTFAGLIGRSDLVPTDRPIDGIDASGFLLGKDDTTGRVAVLFHGPDGEEVNLLSHKLDMAWMYAPALHHVAEFQQSVERYPNIGPGADFNGYTTNRHTAGLPVSGYPKPPDGRLTSPSRRL